MSPTGIWNNAKLNGRVHDLFFFLGGGGLRVSGAFEGFTKFTRV